MRQARTWSCHGVLTATPEAHTFTYARAYVHTLSPEDPFALCPVHRRPFPSDMCPEGPSRTCPLPPSLTNDGVLPRPAIHQPPREVGQIDLPLRDDGEPVPLSQLREHRHVAQEELVGPHVPWEGKIEVRDGPEPLHQRHGLARADEGPQDGGGSAGGPDAAAICLRLNKRHVRPATTALLRTRIYTCLTR